MRRPYFLRRGTSILRPNEYRPADDVPYEPPRGVPPRARRRRHLGDDRAPLHRAVWAHARHEHRILAGASGHGVSGALGARVPARAVPSGRAVRVLFLEALGGVAILGVVLTLVHHAPAPPPTAAAWRGLVALTAGSVLAANLFFFAAVRRIEAAPAAVAATIEPVVGTLLALLLFSQRLTAPGWLGLAMVVGGVAMGYLVEAKPTA